MQLFGDLDFQALHAVVDTAASRGAPERSTLCLHTSQVSHLITATIQGRDLSADTERVLALTHVRHLAFTAHGGRR
jgi:hypothetical protein